METLAAEGRERKRSLPGGSLVMIAGGVFLLLLLLALAVGVARGVGRKPGGETAAKFPVAPDFTLPTFSGGTVTLSDYDDRPVLLFFWASWCVPCQEEAPYIQRAWPEYQRRGYMFVGVNVVDTEADARAFIAKYGFTFPIARDEKGKVYLDYGLDAVSEAFFLHPGRRVLSRFVNGLTESTLADRLQALGEVANQPSSSGRVR